MSDNINPSYYAIIEADVRYDSDLKPNEKLLYAEITALSEKEGYCWAGNKYFAELFEVTKRTVSRWVNNLEDKGYISRKLKRNDKGEVTERKITPVDKKVMGCRQKSHEGIDKNVQENITSVSSTSSNKNNIDEEVPAREIFDLYNELCSSLNTARSLTDKRRKHIRARWREEQDIDVFQEVFEKAEASSFLAGDNDRGWEADLTWIVKNNENFNKILEGKYDDRDDGSSSDPRWNQKL